MTHRVLAATLIASIAALHRPHPILSTDDAKQFRKQTGEAFARLMPPVVDAMLANSTAKADDLAAGDALLRKMNRGAQTVGDMDALAIRGYVRRVYNDRAFQICELFGAARRQSNLPFARGRRVATLGGGPCCCLAGYRVFEDVAELGGGDGAAPRFYDGAAPRFYAFDYAPTWAPCVAALAAALGEPVAFDACDLGAPLAARENDALRAVAPTLDVAILSRTLSEVDQARRDPAWAPLLLELWAALPRSAIVLVKDEAYVEAEARRLLPDAETWAADGVLGTFFRKAPGIS